LFVGHFRDSIFLFEALQFCIFDTLTNIKIQNPACERLRGCAS
jgi:hypothetical protein